MPVPSDCMFLFFVKFSGSENANMKQFARFGTICIVFKKTPP